MNNGSQTFFDRLIGPSLGVLAFVLYYMTLSSGAFPGASSSFVAQCAGLIPSHALSHPLWRWLATLIIDISGVEFVYALNLLSSICGSCSIWMLYFIVSRTVLNTIHIEKSNMILAAVVSRMAGIVSALTFMFSVSFWKASNRAGFGSFDIFLLLGATCVFIHSLRKRHAWMVYLFAFLCGLGAVENEAFLFLGPLFVMYLIYSLWIEEEFSVAYIVKIALFALLGLSVCILQVMYFMGTEGHEIYGEPGVWKLLRLFWLGQMRAVTKGPWLLKFMICAVPWLSCLLIARRGLNDEKDWGFYILHIVMTVFAIIILLDVDWVRSLIGTTGILLLCSLYGYLVAYWFLLPFGWWSASDRQRGSSPARYCSMFLVLPLIAVTAFLPMKNIRIADARSSRMTSWFSREIVKSMSGRTWLVSDGVLTDNILISARQLGKDIRVLNMRFGENESYMRYVASMLDDSRLKNMAYVGMSSLLLEWFKTDPDVSDKVAVLSFPDLWLSADYKVVPNRLVFFGSRSDELDYSQIYTEHGHFWKDAVSVFEVRNSAQSIYEDYEKYFRRHIGIAANNLGVLLEDSLQEEYSEMAFDSYYSAQEIDTNNISALLNMGAMLENGFDSTKSGEIEKKLSLLNTSPRDRSLAWSLARSFGYVRSPVAFAQRGWSWAMSGNPGMAIKDLERAIIMSPEQNTSQAKRALADIYLLDENDDDGEILYEELLMQNPLDKRALISMSRVMIRRRDFKKAKKYLTDAKKAGVSKSVRYLEWASYYIAKGDYDRSRLILEEILADEPDLVRGWALLAEVVSHQGDVPALERASRRLRRDRRGEFIANVLDGQLAMQRNDLDEARRLLSDALSDRPESIDLLQLILILDLRLDLKEEMRSHVRRLLKMDPNNSFGNYVMGSIRMRNKKMALAENSFRKSLEEKRSVEALNDLAWLLAEKGDYSEAIDLAREAIALRDNIYALWDTLGYALMKLGKLDESEKALKKAISLFDRNISVLLHMAQLQAEKGNMTQLREYVDRLSARSDEMSDEDAIILSELRNML